VVNKNKQIKMKYLNKFNNLYKLNEAIDFDSSLRVRQSLRLIMSHFGFFADLFLQLRIGELKPGSKCKTACTDGKSILYNAAFVKTLNTEQLAFILLHELLHNANFHFARKGDRHHKRWNRAADYAINQQIVQLEEETKYGTFSPPPRILLSDKYKIKTDDGYHIMSAEEIYAILDAMPKRPKPPKQKPEPIQIYPGMKVRIKSTGKTGVVRQISGGKFVVDEIKDAYQKVVESLESLNEAAICNLPTVGNPQILDRSDFIPIQKKEKGGKGGTPPPPTNDEYEEEDDDDDEEEEEEEEDDGMDDDDDGDDDDDDDEEDDDDGDERDLTDGDIMKPGSLDKEGQPIKGYEGQEDFQKVKPGDLEKIWKDNITNSRVKNAGTGSKSMDRRFTKIDKPKVNWKQRLRKFVNSVFAREPYYGYFNKRFIGQDDPEYLPGIKYPDSEGFRRIVLIIDTSGSITSETLAKFATEFYGILKDKKVLETIFIWCDDEIQGKPDVVPTTQIRTAADFSKYMDKYVHAKGGGGTSFIPPFAWIERNLIDKGQVPSFVVYFTDAAGPAPRYNEYKIPKYANKVLWVITEASSAPHITFGEKIFIDVDPDGKH
jgi:predicted metal-dependent peptidase